MKQNLIATVFTVMALVTLLAAQVAPQRIRTIEDVMAGRLIKKVAPEYPPQARQAEIQGKVVLRVQISKSGDVESIQMLSGHPMLVPAAIAAVKQWKYKPYLLNGEPVEVETQVTVNFTLADKPAAEGIVGDRPGGIHAGEPGRIAPSNPGDQSVVGTPRRVRVSSGVMQAMVVSKAPPQYPQDAKDQHIEGVVVMRAIIDKDGNVANLQLISGHPLLAPPAIEAVKRWKYQPYLLNGVPVEVETQITVNFTLMN